jgi:Holliday junction resolvase
MSGAKHRQKGDRVEREFVELHRALGVHTERVPLSGASLYQENGGDIDIYVHGRDAAPIIGEVKARKNGAGFKTLEGWLGENDIPFLKRNNASPMVVLPWETWAGLLKRGQP